MSVVGHAPSLLDQRADSGERPSLGREPGRDGPELEGIEDLDPLLRRQAGRTPGLGAALEGIEAEAALTQPLGPLADRPGRDAHAASDLGLRQPARQEEPSGLQATLFLLLGGEFAGLPHAAA
jgi:hypothetical protein